MSFDLEGHSAIVTGGARGIGRAITERLQALGVRVSVWDKIGPDDDGVTPDHYVTVDVSDEANMIRALEETLDALGQVDILVNNAGINGPTKPTWEYTLEEWNRILAIDLTGVFLGCRAVVPHMRERGYGRIVTVASIAGKEGGPNICAYSAAKSGVIGFSKGLARELINTGVTVNCVTPVMVETELFKEMTPEYIETTRARIPMGRFCKATEVADMVAWAASPRCSFTTGNLFDLSGGRATY